MSKRPRKRRPPNPTYEHAVLQGHGFWSLPDLTTCERVEPGRWTNQLVIRAATFDGRRLAIPLLIPAIQSFVAADPIVVPIEKPTEVRVIPPVAPGKTLETPLLCEFVCFRGITREWWLLEFLSGRDDQHVIVSFSVLAYRQLLQHLKEISA